MSRRRRLREVFAMPLLIAAASLFGLVAALTGDGLRDVVAWIALAVPVVAVGWAMVARRS
ncbi:hypothetical protein [Sandaracinobacteroides hominis]|uniref:hypothetical protein n=1 Tax=Sandaracinobacteroides hominis TaxID=2780086 RepID=UPI0018F6A95D|nr:hypothetical protein [Sandaracinobacteroides hominis]